MSTDTPEGKLIALCALKPDVLRLSARVTESCVPLVFLTMSGVEKTDGNFARSIGGTGATLDEAVKELWDEATSYGKDDRVIVNGLRNNRTAYRWNGFMWTPFTEDKG